MALGTDMKGLRLATYLQHCLCKPLFSKGFSYQSVNLDYQRDSLSTFTKTQNPCNCKGFSFGSMSNVGVELVQRKTTRRNLGNPIGEFVREIKQTSSLNCW